VLRDLSVRRTEKIPKVPFSENGSLKREHNPKNPNRSAQPLSNRTPQKVNKPGPVAKKAKGESGLPRPKLFELAA